MESSSIKCHCQLFMSTVWKKSKHIWNLERWYWWSYLQGSKAETPILWPPHAKSWLIGKDWCWRDWGQEEKGTTEDEMVGWHHWLNEHESEWTPGVGDGQGGLACCDSWGCKEADTTEWLNWTELKGETDIKNRLLITVEDRGSGKTWESDIKKYTLPYVKLMACGNLLCDLRNPKPELCDNLEGWDGGGR